MIEQQQKDRNNTSEITFKQIPFNMTVAKRISDGSVRGRVYALYDGIRCDVITYVKSLGSNEVFEIELPSPINVTEVSFAQSGFSIGTYNHQAVRLCIEIPVEDSGDNSQEKDSHYHKCKIEPIEYILANNLGFCEGNVVKYITRYKDKGNPLDDLRKVIVYVNYLIQDLTSK